MWTNVFRLGEFQVISWFQFIPSESDPTSLHDKSLRAELKDSATCAVLSAHLKLQNDGFLSTWTNSFVGPWDPSQGVHNPDEKIKLWLFLPGRHSSIVDTAQAAVSKLRVVGRGVWLAPGDSEEVAVALSQALRNLIERALRGFSYVRFGDVFAKIHSSASFGINFRKVQPTVEFIFAATEEAIYIHVIISAKHVRNLNDDDIERILKRSASNSIRKGLPVIVSPNGMRGRLTGCCPTDLVKQVYASKLKASNESGHGLPIIAKPTGCQLRGQNCFVEVSLGCPPTFSRNFQEKKSSQEINDIKPSSDDPCSVSSGKGHQPDLFPMPERTFIYPVESVLVPVLHRAFARCSLKRFFVKSWARSSLHELWPFWNFGFSSHLLYREFLEALGIDFGNIGLKRKYNSCSDSTCSSTSSTGSTSSGSDNVAGIVTGDLEADADSLTSRQSGLSSNDQFDNDGKKMVSKRLRSSVTDAFGQAATFASATPQNAAKSEFSVADANNSAIGGSANVQNGSSWDWDDEDRGIGIDIQTLLSEFGDFGDFFESDVLDFGEPPGTAESHAITFPSVDCGDISGSPCTAGIDSPDPKLSTVGLTSFDNFNQPSSTFSEDTQGRSLDGAKDAKSSITISRFSASSNGKFDQLTKVEAMLTFAPEYAAVETVSSEFGTSIFRNPYTPSSKRSESSLVTTSAYAYGAMPPSPSMVEENLEKSSKLKPCTGLYSVNNTGQLGKLYTHVHGVIKKNDCKFFNDATPSLVGKKTPSVSAMNSSSGTSALQRNNESSFEAGHFLLSLETLLATEVECIIFQVAMCRIRHTLLTFNSRVPNGFNKLTGDAMIDLISYDTSSLPEVISAKNEGKKKEMLSVRIAGDVHTGLLEPPMIASVGIWRPVGVPKGTKPSNICLSQNSPSLTHNSPYEEAIGFHGQRHPLHELLDAIGLLVQQSASLDIDDVDGSYSWLALEEQQRRGFSCGPAMAHAGCGGILSSCHYMDISGTELVDPLSANVQVSNVISLLQSDIKLGLKSAFPSSEGPLSLTDWCRGRHQLGDSITTGDGYPFQFAASESKDSLSAVPLGGEPISPPQSGGGSSCNREGIRIDDSNQRRSNQDLCGLESENQKSTSRFKPTHAALSMPALLVGYQDDWLKTSVNCLQLWEKCPLEPYALPKPVLYYAVCPDIDLLTSAAADFFQQLGTVYEACKLGSHTPQISGGLVESSSGKLSSSGLLLINCPPELKASNSNMPSISSTTDYFGTLSKCWNVKAYLNSVKKVLKDLKLNANPSPNHKERNVGPSTVVYVVCPFFELTAVLQTVIECSAALGSAVLSSDKERQSLLYNQVSKALISSAAVDEASASNVVMLSGFRIPKLVLQIVTVDSLLRLNKPSKELAVLKEIAFTVYNKVRRIPRTASGADNFQSSAISGRPPLMHVTSAIPGIWKDCLAPRMPGSALTREGELDSSLRPVSWDNSWQARIGGITSDPIRSAELLLDDPRYAFEPLFILAEPLIEHSFHPSVIHNNVPDSSSSKSSMEDSSGMYMQSSSTGAVDIGKGSTLDGSEHDNKAANLHCSYGWTEDWSWLICVWTDSRGELLDCSIFPFGGISSRQDTKVLQNLFVQVLHHCCQILSSSSLDPGGRLRDIIITRIGCYFELECQEWQKAIYSVGGNDVKKWPVQLRRTMPDGVLSSSNGASLEQQEIGLIQERALPSSPSPLYNPHAKSSFIKGGIGQTNAKKQMLTGQTGLESSRGLLQLARSISLVSVSIDHTLHLILPSDSSSGGGQSSGSTGISSYLEGFTPVKSLGSTPCSYLLIPYPSMRFIPPSPLQLSTCLTSESPPLAHLLHSKGSAIPQSTGFVVSKSIPTQRKDFAEPIREDWPSILAVTLIDHYGKGTAVAAKQGRSVGTEAAACRDYEMEAHLVLESVAAELHSLSWMTVSPLYLERRSALPFHCDILMKLRRLLHYAYREFSRRSSEQSEPAADADL